MFSEREDKLRALEIWFHNGNQIIGNRDSKGEMLKQVVVSCL